MVLSTPYYDGSWEFTTATGTTIDGSFLQIPPQPSPVYQREYGLDNSPEPESEKTEFEKLYNCQFHDLLLKFDSLLMQSN